MTAAASGNVWSVPEAATYGWDDLELGHDTNETPLGAQFALSEAVRREVLARLLSLNHERHEEKVQASLHMKEKV